MFTVSSLLDINSLLSTYVWKKLGWKLKKALDNLGS